VSGTGQECGLSKPNVVSRSMGPSQVQCLRWCLPDCGGPVEVGREAGSAGHVADGAGVWPKYPRRSVRMV